MVTVGDGRTYSPSRLQQLQHKVIQGVCCFHSARLKVTGYPEISLFCMIVEITWYSGIQIKT